jgi:hypothetical protein
MKNLFKVFSILLAFVACISLTNCGGDEDPQPLKKETIKTDLQKVQEALTGSKWELTHSQLLAKGKTYDYNADCNFDEFYDLEDDYRATAAAANGVNYNFDTSDKFTFKINCGNNASQQVLYKITQEENSFYITYNQGGSNVLLEIITPISSIDGSTIQVKRITPLVGLATHVIFTYKITN